MLVTWNILLNFFNLMQTYNFKFSLNSQLWLTRLLTELVYTFEWSWKTWSTITPICCKFGKLKVLLIFWSNCDYLGAISCTESCNLNFHSKRVCLKKHSVPSFLIRYKNNGPNIFSFVTYRLKKSWLLIRFLMQKIMTFYQ